MKRLLILVPFLFQMQGCNDANATPSEEKSISVTSAIEYQVLHEANDVDYDYQFSRKSITIINNQTVYDDELSKRTTEASKEVDFALETVLLLDHGVAATAAGRISLDSVTEENDYVRAKVLVHEQADGCAYVEAVQNQFQFIKIKTKKKILVTEEIKKGC